VDNLVSIGQVVQDLAIALAIIVGGGWSFYQFVIQRAYETALGIGALTTCAPMGSEKSVVFVAVSLKNEGHRRISAKPTKYSKGKAMPAYTDSLETIQYACGLRIRRLNPNLTDTAVFEWFKENSWMQIENLPDELNLLESYELSTRSNIDFWMEPGETYHLGKALLLSPGHYFAKITFIGARGSFEFWNHEFYFHVA
jgi:hypothetical protein